MWSPESDISTHCKMVIDAALRVILMTGEMQEGTSAGYGAMIRSDEYKTVIAQLGGHWQKIHDLGQQYEQIRARYIGDDEENFYRK